MATTPPNQVCGGSPVHTPNLHEVSFSPQDPQCVNFGDGKWCYKWVTISVTAPAGWAFIPGTEIVFCTQDNQGSAAWNGLPYRADSNKFQLQSFGPNLITAKALMQSRDIWI